MLGSRQGATMAGRVPPMKLWLISQKQNNGYDTYDSAVVAAESEAAARLITPDGRPFTMEFYYSWCDGPEHVTAQYLGEAEPELKAGVVLASFNAG